jgi:hypothetical protein
MAQVCGNLFAQDPQRYHNQYVAARQHRETYPNDPDGPNPENTFEGLFERYRAEMEALVQRLRDRSVHAVTAGDAAREAPSSGERDG